MKWNLETVSIRSIKENPKNPREIEKDKLHQLDKLIAKFGLIDKPILNADRTLIGVSVFKEKQTKSS